MILMCVSFVPHTIYPASSFLSSSFSSLFSSSSSSSQLGSIHQGWGLQHRSQVPSRGFDLHWRPDHRCMMPCSEKYSYVRLAQKMQVGPYIPVGIQLSKAEVGPISGPTWRLSHSRSLQTPPPAPRPRSAHGNPRPHGRPPPVNEYRTRCKESKARARHR
jgi:hypothetical protein